LSPRDQDGDRPRRRVLVVQDVPQRAAAAGRMREREARPRAQIVPTSSARVPPTASRGARALARARESPYRAGVAEDAMALPEDLVEWIGETAGGKVTATKRVPGGASREAWFVDVDREGETLPLFLRYSRI